jgi:hypothetical protein
MYGMLTFVYDDHSIHEACFLVCRARDNKVRGQVQGAGGDLDKFSHPFKAQLQSHLMARNKSRKKDKNVLKKTKSGVRSANSLPRYQHCWCKGFNISCGVVHTRSTQILHAMRVRECK